MFANALSIIYTNFISNSIENGEILFLKSIHLVK